MSVLCDCAAHALLIRTYSHLSPPLFLVRSLCDRVKQTKSRLTVYLSLLGETNYGGGRHKEICARRQQPHHILLR